MAKSGLFFRSALSKMHKMNLKMMAQVLRRLLEQKSGVLVRMLLLNLVRVRGWKKNESIIKTVKLSRMPINQFTGHDNQKMCAIYFF